METDSPLLTCQLHKSHGTPKPLTVEVHHIMPVGFQLTWQPSVPPYPGNDPNGRGMLWDNRTVACCPTGHRDIHYWIVKLMHAVTDEDPLQAESVVKGRGVQFDWACQALLRFKEYGGSLQALRVAHEYGQI
jgi:hypothetical protein